MKHQEVILVVLGYIIGFTTAFIWFGAGDMRSADQADTVAGTVRSDGYGLVANASRRDQGAAIMDVFVNNEGLFARIGDTDRVISAGTIPPGEEDTAGYHYAVPVMSISPDQQYVHYCTIAGPDDTTCDHYIYNIADDSLYPVKDTQNDTHLVTARDGLTTEWTADGLLVVNDHTSSATHTPWMME